MYGLCTQCMEMFYHLCAHCLIGFRNKNKLLKVLRRYCFGLKYLVLLCQTRPRLFQWFLKNIPIVAATVAGNVSMSRPKNPLVSGLQMLIRRLKQLSLAKSARIYVV